MAKDKGKKNKQVRQDPGVANDQLGENAGERSSPREQPRKSKGK